MFMTNSNFNRDTQLLTRQLIMMRETMDMRNREMEKKLNDLRRMIQTVAEGKSMF